MCSLSDFVNSTYLKIPAVLKFPADFLHKKTKSVFYSIISLNCEIKIELGKFALNFTNKHVISKTKKQLNFLVSVIFMCMQVSEVIT